MITSLQNERVKLARALQTQAKARRSEGKIALEGVRLVRDALEMGQKPDFILYEPDAVNDEGLTMWQQSGAALLPVSTEVMRHISQTQQPQGVLAVFPMPEPALPPRPERVLILDAIRDPGNVGTILRTAAAAGVQTVLLSPTCADAYNPKVLRGGMGAHFRVPVTERDWSAIGVYCRRLTVYLAEGKGSLVYHRVDWTAPWALIIGSEAHGAGGEAERLAQQRVTIPMAAATESLNAAAAAAIILFEAARQRSV
ncbi:MAG: RNA methyltransferase [Chloroflexi bacterium]|nr:RNA methyltransferase [Chloroflexota bacterium]